MRPTSTRRRRQQRRRGDEGGHGGGASMERWLLTYADMITLLLALFIVLFSISAVNISKFHTLKEALAAAFSPKVLSGGGSILPGGSSPSPHAAVAAAAAAITGGQDSAIERAEEDQFKRLKEKLDAYARSHGFAKSIETAVDARGLVIRLLTDRVLFDSGSATLKPQASPLLSEISDLVDLDRTHPISVEGNTDDVPISTSRYPSNWELSVDRATGVVRFMIAHGVAADRLEASGVAGERPIAPNTTAAGRYRNRRVEIALLRGDSPQGGER